MKTTMLRKPMMRAAILALCSTALSPVPMKAQDNAAPPPPSSDHMGGRGGRMQEHQVEMLTKKLNLSLDQVTQLKAIQEDTMKQAMAVRDDTSIAKADKRVKMMEIHKAAQDKIHALLNDEQKTKYDALEAQMRERRMNHEHGQGGPPPAPPSQQ